MPGISKKDHNKKNYERHAPYPLRLGILKPLVMRDSVLQDRSGHYILIKIIEKHYSEDIRELELKAAEKYPEVLSLIKLYWNIDDALSKVCIHKNLFFNGLTLEQKKEIGYHIRRTEEGEYNIRQKNIEYKRKKVKVA